MSAMNSETLKIASVLLQKLERPSIEDITDAVAKARLLTICPESDVARIVRELESRFNVQAGLGGELFDSTNHVEWLSSRRGAIEWRYWKRYETYLEQDVQLERGPLLRLDELTDAILRQLEDPSREGAWDRRGLVAGHVQSGKTSNYTGLICKAADAGYKVLIVLAGVHNSLRSQTQQRLDEGFLGYDSIDMLKPGPKRRIGAGRFDSGIQNPDTITNRSENGDFNRRVAGHFSIHAGGSPLLFVIKKNVSVL